MANPNPSPENQFKPGQSGNPGGKTREHRQAEIEAAELAAKVQLDLVKALANTLTNLAGDKDKLDYLNKEVNTLIKNAQDRGFGAPVQPTTDGVDADMTPAVIRIVPVAPASEPENG